MAQIQSIGTGPTGPQGPPGSQIITERISYTGYSGKNLPVKVLEAGHYYLNKSTGQLLLSNGNTWDPLPQSKNTYYFLDISSSQICLISPSGQIRALRPRVGDIFLDIKTGRMLVFRGQGWSLKGVLCAETMGKIGPPGASGPPGPIGLDGPQGIQGVMGEIGPVGERGNPGLPGPQGIQGVKGDPGPPGTAGAIGPMGPTGERGDPGINGSEEIQGVKGDPGPPGTIGPMGPTGERGYPGSDGEMGPIGPRGAPGERGLTGIRGLCGSKGEVGPTGPTGAMGPTGEIGPTGAVECLEQYLNLPLGNITDESSSVHISFIRSSDNQRFPVTLQPQETKASIQISQVCSQIMLSWRNLPHFTIPYLKVDRSPEYLHGVICLTFSEEIAEKYLRDGIHFIPIVDNELQISTALIQGSEIKISKCIQEDFCSSGAIYTLPDYTLTYLTTT